MVAQLKKVRYLQLQYYSSTVVVVSMSIANGRVREEWAVHKFEIQESLGDVFRPWN